MKKVIAVLVLVVYMTLFFSPPALAAEDFAFALSSDTVFSYKECAVVLSITANSGMTASSLIITYDHTQVAFSRYEVSKSFSADVVSVTDNKKGEVNFSFLSTKGVIRDKGNVLTLYFTPAVSSSCQSAISIKKTSNSLFDADYYPADFNFTPGSASFTSPSLWLNGGKYNLDHISKTITNVPPQTIPVDFREVLGGSFMLSLSSPYVGTGDTVAADGETYYIIVTGDITGDGVVGLIDYIFVQMAALEAVTLSQAERYAADTDGNGNITVTDVIAMRLYMLGISDLVRQN